MDEKIRLIEENKNSVNDNCTNKTYAIQKMFLGAKIQMYEYKKKLF